MTVAVTVHRKLIYPNQRKDLDEPIVWHLENTIFRGFTAKTINQDNQFTMSAVAVYTLFYILLSAGLVYPPPEFISAGLTITRLFSKFLGSENECFIHYHIRRVEVTLLVHTCLPLVYILGLWYADPGLKFSELFFTNATFLWKIFVLVSLVTPMLAAFKVYQWEKYKWRGHPIIKNLRAYCNSRTDWVMLAGMIGQEFRG